MLKQMGLLALEVARFGVVMSADSQPVELLDGENRANRRRLEEGIRS